MRLRFVAPPDNTAYNIIHDSVSTSSPLSGTFFKIPNIHLEVGQMGLLVKKVINCQNCYAGCHAENILLPTAANGMTLQTL